MLASLWRCTYYNDNTYIWGGLMFTIFVIFVWRVSTITFANKQEALHGSNLRGVAIPGTEPNWSGTIEGKSWVNHRVEGSLKKIYNIALTQLSIENCEFTVQESSVTHTDMCTHSDSWNHSYRPSRTYNGVPKWWWDFVPSGVTGGHTGKTYRGRDGDKNRGKLQPHLSLLLHHSLSRSVGCQKCELV